MQSIQTAKDTFYAALRDRIAANNPERTIVVRGVLRSAVLVVENEVPGTAVDGISLAETFCLRWSGFSVDTQSAGSLARMVCEIRYASDGTAAAGGLDRGRALAAMDAELFAAAIATPMNAGLATGTNLFWSQPVFGALKVRGERLERSAEVEVFTYAS